MKLIDELVTLAKKKFIKKKVPPPTLVDNTKYYEKMLHTLKNDRASIAIKFEQSQETYISMILDVDINRQFIIIDEVNSTLGHRLACNYEPFVISAKENGMVVFFHSQVLDYGTINGISFYRIAFPNHIERLQRRGFTRLKPPPEISLQADFLLAHHGVVRAKIVDISLSGLKLMLPRNVKSVFESFSRISHCRVMNPFISANEFTLDLRYCIYDASAQKTFIGCEFANLDNTGLKFLSTLTQHLQTPI
ncbi:MAG: flagellar brake protein [Candidatus Berkiella sp.]